MKQLIFLFAVISTSLTAAAQDLRPALETTYSAWREAMMRKDPSAWQRVTAEHRRIEVKNRILSEKRPFPASVFELPAPPPSIRGLKFLDAKQNGPTAKAFYFGKIDFGIGGEPMDNLLVLSFVKGSGGWLYDKADFVSLIALPGVRKELALGDLKYLQETPECRPSGKVPPSPIEVGRAKHIAKAYVFCPGREVELQINKVSRHRFANAKEAQIVVGGAQDGTNEVQFTIKKLPGGTGKEAMTIRVYLMPESAGPKPNKVFEYQVNEGGKAKSGGTMSFTVDAAALLKIKK